MKVSATSEELAKHIKGITTSSSSLSALFVLLDSLGTMSIVDFAQFGVGEDFVGFADLGEFAGCRFVVRVLVGMIFFREAAVRLFEIAFRS